MNIKNNLVINDFNVLLEFADFEKIISFISGCTLGYVGYNALKKNNKNNDKDTEDIYRSVKKHVINKCFKPKNVRKVSMPPELIRNNNSYDGLIVDSEYIDDINKFIDVVVKNIDDNNLTCFYNNIKSLCVKRVDNFDKNTIVGTYDQKKNIIYLRDNYGIFHELFHMSSAYTTKKIEYSGFLQLYKNYFIGSGLNEGYTQLLTERYFSDVPGIVDSGYTVEKLFMEDIEKIVGKDKLEELYFNVNLYGLVNELRKYSSDYQIMKFISDMDFIKHYCSNYIDDKYMIDMLLGRFDDVSMFLIRTYFNKMISNVDGIYLSDEELDKLISFSPQFSIDINDNMYEIPNFDKYMNLMNELVSFKDGECLINSRVDCKKRELKRIYVCR